MAKPTLLSVDDDTQVLRAVVRDLRQHYGDRFRILSADSGAKAMDVVRQLHAREEEVALFLVDQRMPEITGVAFLQEAKLVFPRACRVLLTAYADTEAAVQAINKAQIQYYLSKPWDPPQEKLYPILDDLLEEWEAGYRPAFEGITLVGHRWSPLTHGVKDFLARNQVPYRWIDIEARETDPEAKRVIEQLGEDANHLPVVLFGDGSTLVEPTNAAVAEKIGLQTHAEKPFYDLVIIGGGPAGLAAGVYGASEGLRTLMIEREAPGGQAGMSSRIENYLGFPAGLSGGELARRAVTQARRFGVEVLTPQEATALSIDNPYRTIHLADGTEVNCHALLLAMGVSWRKLDVPGLEKLTGAGVYYGAAMTEAISCQDQDVHIIGGANSAGQAAMYFSQYAKKVTMLVRAGDLTHSMSRYLIDQIERTPNIHVRPCCLLVEAHGETSLESITVADANTNTSETVPATALFIFIGAKPHTEWLGDVLCRDERGFIMTGPDILVEGKRPKSWPLDRDPFLLESNIPGVFAAGDVRHGSVKRVASGVGEGSIAVQFIHQYLAKVRA